MAESKLRKWLSPKKRAEGYATERKKGIHERGPNKDQPLDDYNKGLRSGYMLAQSDNAGLYRYKQAREAGFSKEEAQALLTIAISSSSPFSYGYGKNKKAPT